MDALMSGQLGSFHLNGIVQLSEQLRRRTASTSLSPGFYPNMGKSHTGDPEVTSLYLGLDDFPSMQYDLHAYLVSRELR